MNVYKKIGIAAWLLSLGTLNGNPFTSYWYPQADSIASGYISSANKREFATKEVNDELKRYKQQHPSRFAQAAQSNGQPVDAKKRTAQIRLEQAVALEMYKANLQLVLDQWNELSKKNDAFKPKITALTEYLAMINSTISSLLS